MNRQNLLMIAMATLLFGALELSASSAEAQCAWGAASPVMNAATAPGTFSSGVECRSSNGLYYARSWMSGFFFPGQWAARGLSARRSLGSCGGGNETNVGLLVVGNVINFNTGAFAFRFRQDSAPTCDKVVSRTWTTLSNTGWIQGQCHVGVGAACVVPQQG